MEGLDSGGDVDIEKEMDRWKVSNPSSVTCCPWSLGQVTSSLESQFHHL